MYFEKDRNRRIKKLLSHSRCLPPPPPSPRNTYRRKLLIPCPSGQRGLIALVGRCGKWITKCGTSHCYFEGYNSYFCDCRMSRSLLLRALCIHFNIRRIVIAVVDSLTVQLCETDICLSSVRVTVCCERQRRRRLRRRTIIRPNRSLHIHNHLIKKTWWPFLARPHSSTARLYHLGQQIGTY